MRAKLILPFLILYLFCHLLSVQGHEVDIVNAGSDKNVASSQVYEVTSEGAWCWFADPRALHYENEKGTINRISRKIFNTDENTRKYNGVLLSPNARSIFEIML